MGLSQDQYSQMLGLYAGSRVGEAQQIKTARDAEIAKLGATGPARVDTVLNWTKAMVGEDSARALSQMLVTAAHVEAFEKLITRMSSQGGGSFKTNGRDPNQSNGIDDAAYEKLSFAQKMNYARTRDPNKTA